METSVSLLQRLRRPDEAAAWAHRNMSAKNTLTAADAKIVEERFQARLSTIRDGIVPADEPCASPGADLVPSGTIPDPPHAVPDQTIVSPGLAASLSSEKGPAATGKRRRTVLPKAPPALLRGATH